uniref:Cytochrome c oxidase assembly protein COX20, mitochondrial n=1 Tax=Gasterosteus aculeatus aculeatus TaxID=481459 RepID=A0AAQ4RB86_GASAC
MAEEEQERKPKGFRLLGILDVQNTPCSRDAVLHGAGGSVAAGLLHFLATNGKVPHGNMTQLSAVVSPVRRSGEEVVRRGVCWLHAHYARVLVLLQNEQRKASRAAEDDQRRDPEQGRLRGHQCRPHKKTWSRNAIGALVTSRLETPPLAEERTPSYRDVL